MALDYVVHLIILLLPSKMVHTIATSKTATPMDHISMASAGGGWTAALEEFCSPELVKTNARQAEVGETNSDWSLRSTTMTLSVNMNISEWAQVLQGCGHLLNNWLNLWNKETFSSVLYIFPTHAYCRFLDLEACSNSRMAISPLSGGGRSGNFLLILTASISPVLVRKHLVTSPKAPSPRKFIWKKSSYSDVELPLWNGGVIHTIRCSVHHHVKGSVLFLRLKHDKYFCTQFSNVCSYDLSASGCHRSGSGNQLDLISPLIFSPSSISNTQQHLKEILSK